jgi:hypothetical protein
MADATTPLPAAALNLALEDIAFRLQSVRRTVFLAREASLGEEPSQVRAIPRTLAMAIHGIENIGGILRSLAVVTDETEANRIA